MPFLMQAAVYYAFKLKLPLYGGIMAVVPAIKNLLIKEIVTNFYTRLS
jgi:hypothetical protein